MKSIKGFTLLELLIAFSLSMVIFMTLTQLIISEKIQYTKQQQFMDIQEAGQAATLIFHEGFHEMQSATKECQPHLWLDHRGNHDFNLLPKGNQWAIYRDKKNKEHFVLQHWKTPLVPLSQSMATLQELQVNDHQVIIKKNTPVVITDCQLAEIATVAAVHHRKGALMISLKESLSDAYGKDKVKSWIAPLLQETYYVDTTHRYNSVGQPISALYVKDISNAVYELVPCIMDMHINNEDKSIHFQMHITSLEAIKGMTFSTFNKKFPLWMKQGRLHLLWDIVLRKSHD